MSTNIIVAAFGSMRRIKTRPAWLIDHGMILKFAGLDLPATYEVHFSNSKTQDAKRVIGNADGVVIPDEYFLSGADHIYAWLYLSAGDNSGFTAYEAEIPLIQRPGTTDAQPDPQQTDIIEQAIAALNDAVEQTSADVESAHAAVEAAENAAEAAAASAQGVEQYATAARQAATEAANSASAAESSASDAQGAADNASASADRAEQAAASIEGDTERAEAAARTAQGAASDASGFAGTASTKATEAAGSAATAEQAAADALASATAAAGSASSASASATAAGNAQTAAETAQGKAEDAQEAAETAAQSIEDSAAQIDTNTADILNLKSALNTKAGIIRDTASGSVASFVPDATVPNLLGLSVALEPIQDLHGYDSPWPAGGGKNKLQVTASTTTKGGVTFTVNTDGTVVANGTATETVSFGVGTYVGEGVAVKASGCPSGGNRTDKYRIFNTYIGSDEGNGTSAATPEAGVSCSVFIYVYAGYTATNLVFKPMIRLASVTDPTFAPYSNICPISGRDSVTVNANGTTYTIPLPETVYGGDIGVVSGSGESKMAMVILYSQFRRSSGTRYTVRRDLIGNIADVVSSDRFRPWKTGESFSTPNTMFIDSTYINFNTPKSYATLSDFLADYADTELLYRFATPTPISTTPTEIGTVEGQNNVFSPDGDVTVEYAADLKTYIDNKIAAAVAALS